MRMCAKRLGLVTLLSAVALVALTGACYAKDDAWLGVVLQPLNDNLKDAMDIGEDIGGVLVSDVVDDSPADKSGIEDGDVIISIGDEDTDTVKEAVRAIKAYSPGDDVEIVILRDGDRKRTLKVELAERDEDKIADLDLDFDFDMIPNIERAFKGWTGESQGFLGVQIQEMSRDLAEYFDVGEDEGILVLEVTEDSPAEGAGLKAGDVILEYNGKEVSDTDRLVKLVRAGDPGDKVEIKIKRKRRTQTVDVELGETGSAAKIYVKDLIGPGKRKQIIMPRGHDMEIPDIDEIEIHKFHQDDLREDLEELREELEELREELKEIRES
jgi:C-terminal processing protease CtpA/Prc